MKVIDLLNKIANGEEVPKKIIYDGDIWEYDKLSNDYEMFDESGDLYLFQEELYVTRALNDEIEIIEEDKKIEKIKSLNNVGDCPNLVEFGDKQQLNNHILKDKINEIIKEINKLKDDRK